MAADLPDIEQSLSYVVDDGEARGPFALTEIARSIAAGERSSESYVWWVGAHEWVAFNSDERLMILLPNLQESPESTMPAVPVDSVLAEKPEDDVAALEGEPEVDVEPEADVKVEVEVPAVEIDLAETEIPTSEDEDSGFVHAEAVETETETEAEVLEPVVPQMATVPAHAASVDPVRTAPVLPKSEIVDEPAIDLRPVDISEVVELDEISISQDSVLAGVSARLEALTSATRHYQSSMKLDAAGATPVETPEAPETPDIAIDSEPTDVRTSVFGSEFDAIVRRTAHYQRLAEQSERVRELLSRACAAVISQHGYSVERRTELRGHYFLNFEHGADTRQMRIEITPAPSVGGDEAQYVSMTMTWGRLAFDIDEALETLLGQPPMANAGPGVISIDADLDNGSVSTRINLVMPVDTYIGDDFVIDREALQDALAAVQHALEQRWYELFIPAE